jgi:hypothetical protein
VYQSKEDRGQDSLDSDCLRSLPKHVVEVDIELIAGRVYQSPRHLTTITVGRSHQFHRREFDLLKAEHTSRSEHQLAVILYYSTIRSQHYLIRTDESVKRGWPDELNVA